ncbi:metal ABC transporter solute-binding protein, Zn/Mn family [Bacillus suaedaesalsae]|uniref:Zinc ABC transporter substrate-binding protein n=1 Tax=Bacillus suaedaesalsae TaxID=2810349 RepID=A0ABS2DDY9_9BACI|nr:zinc ABC transporter substrate-binding protein [Bacillus suaedaesalsae]MBM6616672.1 zinc ABC transporter substrate-binding protein [Bacillus suaedaesalsae]
MRTKHTLLVLLLMLSAFLFGCNTETKEVTPKEETQNAETTDEKLKVYTTIFPLEDFAKRIGGDHVEVVSVFPPGVDAHSFEPTAKTMVDMAKADAFIYTGAGIEGFAEAATEALQNEEVRIVKATEGMDLVKLEEHAHDEEGHDDHDGEEGHDDHAHDEEGHDDHEGEKEHDDHNHGGQDPHVWLDPLLAIQLAENILHAFEELNPAAKEEFEQNFNKLKLDLEALDSEFKTVIDTGKTKEILVSHAAYGYWESRYGLEQISVLGLTPTNEPSQQELTEIIKTAEEHNIRYLIFEQNVSSKVADIVKNEIKAEALTLHNLEAITDEDIKNNEDYFSIMKRNLETLKTALN